MLFNKTSQSYCVSPSEEDMRELIHFLRTPLSSITIGAQIIHDVLPALIEGYKHSVQHNRVDSTVSDLKLAKLDTVVNNIISEVARVSEHVNGIEKKIIGNGDKYE